MALRRSCHPTQLAAQLSAYLTAQPASQQCTQMPRNGSVRPFSAICVHYCVPLRHHRPPAQPPCRNSVHKCPGTASRGRFRRSVYTIASPPAARATPVSQQCTQMPQNGSEETFSPICVHYCIPTRPPARPPRRNSVHKCPGTASKGRFRRSVYTIASPCVTRGRSRDPRASTVYTNAPERRREAIFGDLCTLLRPPASPRAARAGLAAQQCTQSRSP